MRVTVTMVVLVASCRFDPTGGTGPVEDGAVTADAAPVDGAPIDAMATDARPIDARMIDARPACPTTYDVVHSGSRYSFRPIAMQHAIAKADCDGDLPGRTHLATFELGDNMDGAVTAVNPGNSAQPYVGGRCVALDCNLKVSWLWETFLPVSQNLWVELQPDNGNAEKVTIVDHTHGTWMLMNVSAMSTLPYICECDP